MTYPIINPVWSTVANAAGAAGPTATYGNAEALRDLLEKSKTELGSSKASERDEGPLHQGKRDEK